jgi:hypothetical protein
MKAIFTLLAVTSLFAAGQTKTFTGVITDSMCGSDHAMMDVKPDAKCVTECVKQGSKYALQDGKKTYSLSDQKTPEKFAGQKVKVTGDLDEKTNSIQVKSIMPAK